MQVYEYRHEESGDIETLERSIHDKRKVPQKIKRGGRTFERVFGASVSAGVAAIAHGYPYVSNALPRQKTKVGTALIDRETGEPTLDQEKGKRVPVYEQTKRMVTSRRHEREVSAETGFVRD